MTARTITGKTNVWMHSEYRSPRELEGDPQHAIDMLAFYQTLTTGGYVQVGTAEITVTIFDQPTMTTRAIASLRAEQQRERAEAEARITKLESKIQQLLAIEAPAADARQVAESVE